MKPCSGLTEVSEHSSGRSLGAAVGDASPSTVAPGEPGVLDFVVSLDHIARGLRHSGGHCPIALALKDAGHDVLAVCSYAVFADGHRYTDPDCPSALSHFVHAFDDGEAVHPERFRLVL